MIRVIFLFRVGGKKKYKLTRTMTILPAVFSFPSFQEPKKTLDGKGGIRRKRSSGKNENGR